MQLNVKDKIQGENLGLGLRLFLKPIKLVSIFISIPLYFFPELHMCLLRGY